MLFFLSIYAIGILGFILHVYMLPRKERTKSRVLELFLLYQLVFSLGVTSLISFIGLTFMSEYIADYMQWPLCPFMQELGNVNLAFGILGILCIWYRGLFWMATIIGFSIWILSDGIHHLALYFTENDAIGGNIGVMLYTDIIVPIILLILYYFYSKTRLAKTSE